MVWPILISEAVTPRISAADAGPGSASIATAPSAANPSANLLANLLARCIGSPSPVAARINDAAIRPARFTTLLSRAKQCHGAGVEAIHNRYVRDANAGLRTIKKSA